MPPRRAHTKSRHGCERCKRRRIKCDESGPPCTNCIARNADCQYPNGPLFRHSDWSKRPQQTPSRTGEHTANISPHTGETPSSPESHPRSDRIRDLGLMHHWCTKTCHSFSARLSDVFQNYVVRQSLHHPFLLDSLLALTSLHITSDFATNGSMGPDEFPGSAADYLQDALRYQNDAASSFRVALQDISPSNCDALFACAVIMMPCAVVSPFLKAGGAAGKSAGREEPRSAAMDLTLLFHFVKGIHSVIDKAHPWLAEGPFKDVIVTHAAEDWVSPQPPGDDINIPRLRRLCEHANPISGECYDRAITMLANCVVKDNMMTIPWLLVAGDEFLNGVREGDPRALLIYMHWGVLLNRLEGIWWAGVSGRGIVGHLAEVLCGHGEEWDDAVGWARGEIMQNEQSKGV